VNSLPTPSPSADDAAHSSRGTDHGRKCVMITGGARRVGASIAHSFARAGCDLVLTYRTSDDAAKTLAASLAASYRVSVRTLPLDLNDPQAVEAFGQQLAASLPRLDVLVHNAAVYAPTPLSDVSAEDALHAYRVNALAPLLLSKHLAPRLAEAQSRAGASGAIVALLDIHAIGRPRSGFAAYAMSKAALHEMVRSLAKELAPSVRVNGVAPGVVDWPQHGDESQAAFQHAYLARVPLNRPGTPDDAAEAVRWLALDALYTTGEVIRIDGGRAIA